MSDDATDPTATDDTSIIWAPTTRDVVTVAGPEAETYLQGQLSQDVAALDHGESAATFVLGPQGKVEGWGRVHRVGDQAFEIDVDPGAGPAWEARLRRFLLQTKAEVTVDEAVPAVAVRGLYSTPDLGVDVLLLGVQNDPLAGGQGVAAMAATVINAGATSRRVMWQGTGHGAIVYSACALPPVLGYLETGEVPPTDTFCPA